MTTATAVAFACAVAFVAGAVKGLTVLGFGLVAAPPLAMVLDPREVLVVLVLPALLMDVVLATAGRRRGPARPAIPVTALLIGGAAGVGLGVLALDVFDPGVLAVAVGTAVLAGTLLGARRPGPTAAAATSGAPSGGVTARWEPGVQSVVGFAAGLTGVFGPPVVAYLQRRGLDKHALATTAALTFVCFGSLRLVVMAAFGLVSAGLLAVSALLFVPGIAGFALGARLRHRLPPTAFTRAVQVLVVASSALLVAQNLPH